MSPRERVRKAISHQEADRIPVDLGSTLVTGIQASTYAKLRRALGLKDEPVKIADPFQMLSYVEMEVIERKVPIENLMAMFETVREFRY